MDQTESEVIPQALNIRFADASSLPIPHVNAMGIHQGSDEFFFTLGVVVPPDQEELTAVMEAGYVIAQPVFRFAVSRDTMEKFLALMAGQYDQQTALNKRLHQQNSEASKKEASRNE